MGLRNYSRNPIDFGSLKRGFLANEALREIEGHGTKPLNNNLFFLADKGLLKRLYEASDSDKLMQIDAAYSQRNRQVNSQKNKEVDLAYSQRDSDNIAESEMLWEQWESGYLADECFRFPTLKERGFKSFEVEAFEDYEATVTTDRILEIEKAYDEDLDLADVLPSVTQLSEWARNRLEYKIKMENRGIKSPVAQVIGFIEVPSECLYDNCVPLSLYDINVEQDKVACGGARRYN